MAETLSATTSTAAPQEGGLKKTLKLLYVYTLATGAIFTFMVTGTASSCRTAARQRFWASSS